MKGRTEIGEGWKGGGKSRRKQVMQKGRVEREKERLQEREGKEKEQERYERRLRERRRNLVKEKKEDNTEGRKGKIKHGKSKRTMKLWENRVGEREEKEERGKK